MRASRPAACSRMRGMRELALLGLIACGPSRHDATCSSPPCNNEDAAIDTLCPAIHFTAMPTTPSIEMLIDQSGSMSSAFGALTRYAAVRAALVASGTGVIDQLQGQAYFGATVYTKAFARPALQSVPGTFNNDPPIANLIDTNGPGLYTPTGAAIDAVVADFAAHPPPAGSPPIIVL